MNKIIDLDVASIELHDATNRYEAMQAHVHKVDGEIAMLVHVQKNLEANISVLKSRQIITVAVEYRKAREDLGKVHNNLTMLKLNKNSLEHSTEQARKFVVECRERYQAALSVQGERVIEVDFRRKDDRQDGDPA